MLAVIVWLLLWLLGQLPLDEQFKQFVRVFVIVIAIIYLLSLLAGVAPWSWPMQR